MEEPKGIVHSALWAAYGDALGFISELADLKGLKRRIRDQSVRATVSWRRSVGGKFGAVVELPAGAYSDDTQLRLATGRSIRGDGHFDVEAFAKVELTLWLTYSLGGGKSTKAAAAALAHPKVAWFSNFFQSGKVRYVDAGGNGAAMRIQPLVWSAGSSSEMSETLIKVVRNCICSHGHPRAIAGAAFHALCLGYTLEKKSIPGPPEWNNFAQQVSDLPDLIQQDPELQAFWIPTWEERSHNTLESAFSATQVEMIAELQTAEHHLSDASLQGYSELTSALNALSQETRGSGTKTAILAACLAWMFRLQPVENALITAVNLLGSDTDTIATMAGAILGARANERPKGAIQDGEYIEAEALRLYSISAGQKAQSFHYPDLLRWQPPRTQLDGIIGTNGSISLSGMGTAQPFGAKYPARAGDGAWQWVKLDFGQTILAKRREALHPNDFKAPQSLVDDRAQDCSGSLAPAQSQTSLFGSQTVPFSDLKKEESIDELTKEAIRSGFNSQVVGDHLLMLAERPEGIELSIAYTAIIAKARRARIEASRRARS